MKLSELNKVTLSQVQNNDDIIIGHSVQNDGEEKSIKKIGIYATSFSTKEDVVALAEQSKQLVQLIGVLTKKLNAAEKRIKTLENQVANTDNRLTYLAATIEDEIITY